ncbi:MAG: NADH-quinone oxidoreductase subunit J [Actinomycetota bacterium]|nr:NADH-quinone oxidoreductase subunit J [Actinomycetota bacterium]
MTGVLAVTVPDLATFVVAGAVVLASAIGVVVARNPVHSALFLVATLFGVAVLFVEQQAEFLAAVQVIVYAGAIVVLFLFVIMLLGVDRPEGLARDPLRGQRPLGAVLVLVSLAEILALARLHWATGHGTAGSTGGASGNVAALGRSVFTAYLLPFEITSALLIIAVVGAVVLARRPHRVSQQQYGARDERMVATERSGTGRSGTEPSGTGRSGT